jgi:hypothetical protein
VERRECEVGVSAAQDEERMLEAIPVLRAEPKVHMATCSGAGQVFGVRLILLPPEGVTADRLSHILQCHSARVLLGQVDHAQLPNDPTWLPDSWVDIDVKAEGATFVVTLNGEHVSDNLRILHRATAFAAAHPAITRSTQATRQ